MNSRPSQVLDTYITTIRDQPIPHSELIKSLEAMRDQFQQEEAEAYRSLKAVTEYYKVHAQLDRPFNKLTGRKDEDKKNKKTKS